MVLGEFRNWDYHQGEVDLESGDRLVLYTDGVTEARNAEGDEFGETRLSSLLAENIHLDAPALQVKLIRAVSHYCDGHFQDDATLIVLAVK